jgi:hypothetical protein
MTRPPVSAAQIVPTTLKKAMLALFFLALSILGMIHPANAQEVTYIIFDPPGSTVTNPHSINAEGAITGSYNGHGFLRARDGTITTFDAPGATSTFPVSINRAGAIAGSYDDANSVLHGFLRSPDGNFTTFDPPGSKGDPFGPGTGVAAINGAGEITGAYEGKPNPDGRIPIHGFLRSRHGTFTTFDPPGSVGTFPASINAETAITGSYSDGQNIHGFLRARDGTITTFDVPGPTSNPNPIGINQAGEIAGSYLDPQGNYSHGFLRSRDGTFTTFDVPAATQTVPTGINSKGEITGSYDDAQYVSHGFLRAPDGTVTTFDPPGYTGTGPTGINSAGTITGSVNGHGFVGIEDKREREEDERGDKN